MSNPSPAPQEAQSSSMHCGDSASQSTAPSSGSDVQVGVSAMLADGDGGLTADANVVSSGDLSVIDTGSDGAIDFGATAKFTSLALGDGGNHGFAAPAADTGVQIAVTADAPTDIGITGTDLGLLGGDPLSISSLDIPSLDLCSLGHQI